MLLHIPCAKPPWTGVGKRLESMVRKAIYDFELISDTSPIAVALSGGKDSLALLFLLHAIKGRGCPDFPLLAIHIDGDYTCGAGVDKSFLKGICKNLEIPLFIKTTDQKKEDLECYSCSRTRRTLLFQTAKEQGCTKIAFGHHRDDNNQTLLMNLLHKGEFAGNLPKVNMHDYGIQILRPLMYAPESLIIEFAKQYEFLRISCQCPVGQNSLRKQTKSLIEEIEKTYPNTSGNLFQASLNYGSKKAQKP
jgi:tRNA(Ile)-lysidine synthase TilS/MesJ